MPETADLILINGKIQTMAGALASAVACVGERILAVGTNDDALSLRGTGTEVVDLGGRLVLPAFTDSHIHFAGFAISRTRVDLKGVTSLDEAARRVASAADRAPRGSWILGRGWLHDLWGGAQPTHSILDAAAPGHPVALSRNDGHALWVSGEAMRLAGVTRDLADPPGGQILRDESGEPIGVLTERAMDLVTSIIPSPSVDDLAQAIDEAMPVAHRSGLASVTCMENLDAYRAFRQLKERGRLQLRVGMCLALDAFDEEVEQIKREGRGDAWLHWTHLKFFADGALGPRTAWMLEPYDDDSSNRGICVTPPDEMRRLVERAAREGIGCAVHAIGDAANRAVLDAFEATRALWQPRGLRPRIEHAQSTTPADIPRFKQIGVVASMQPMHATQDMIVADQAWGARVAYSYAFRSLIDAGARLAFGSDCPVETLDVLQGIYAAVALRRADGYPPGGWHPEQRVTVAEAAAAYTSGAAWAEGEELRRGTIEPGKLADLVILSDDIFVGPPEVLLQTRVEGTIVGGQWAHREI
jgi:predicted amidohydrolase YtcJ